jgi:DNA-binding winged helix-turn-helix (wHTH) protein
MNIGEPGLARSMSIAARSGGRSLMTHAVGEESANRAAAAIESIGQPRPTSDFESLQVPTQDAASMRSGALTGDVLSFGSFSLVPDERLLTKEGVPVKLGGRALDILIALASRPNEIICKHDLLGLVWPDVIVEEGSLRFHIASLRRALGDGKDGARYITTLKGRGYCFVATLSRQKKLGAPEMAPAVRLPSPDMPNRPTWIVGRTADVAALGSSSLLIGS